MINTLKKASVIFLALSGLATANISIDEEKMAVRASSAAYHNQNVADTKNISDSINYFEENGWETEFFNTYPQTSQYSSNVNNNMVKKNHFLEQYINDNQRQLNAIEQVNLESFLVRTQVFVAYKGNQVVISFRGSDDWSNWLLDSMAMPTEFLNTGTHVHTGFNAYLNEAIKDKKFNAWFTKNVNKNSDIIVTGHSLGAGVSVLMGAYLLENGFSADHVKLVTFAEPAPGDFSFAQRYQAKFDNYIWNVNYADPVVWITEYVDYH
ncbi:lipase family protein, partial [Francisellaceae bacterium]|nr:lipase family protein [Francisellaceae bacterium]